MDKGFDYFVPFPTAPQGRSPLPIVTVGLGNRAGGMKVRIPLLFDTGASFVIVRQEMAAAIGVGDWTSGSRVDFMTAMGTRSFFLHPARLGVFGKEIDCDVAFGEVAAHDQYQGFLGRQGVFDSFGFGFWESERRIYVSLNP